MKNWRPRWKPISNKIYRIHNPTIDAKIRVTHFHLARQEIEWIINKEWSTLLQVTKTPNFHNETASNTTTLNRQPTSKNAGFSHSTTTFKWSGQTSYAQWKQLLVKYHSIPIAWNDEFGVGNLPVLRLLLLLNAFLYWYSVCFAS